MDNEREVIDRTQCKLPQNHYMYKVVGTYGREFLAYVSAKDEKSAKQTFKRVYDYLKPKILSIEMTCDNPEMVFDRSKMLILGKMDILERRYTI